MASATAAATGGRRLQLPSRGRNGRAGAATAEPRPQMPSGGGNWLAAARKTGDQAAGKTHGLLS